MAFISPTPNSLYAIHIHLNRGEVLLYSPWCNANFLLLDNKWNDFSWYNFVKDCKSYFFDFRSCAIKI